MCGSDLRPLGCPTIRSTLDNGLSKLSRKRLFENYTSFVLFSHKICCTLFECFLCLAKSGKNVNGVFWSKSKSLLDNSTGLRCFFYIIRHFCEQYHNVLSSSSSQTARMFCANFTTFSKIFTFKITVMTTCKNLHVLSTQWLFSRRKGKRIHEKCERLKSKIVHFLYL